MIQCDNNQYICLFEKFIYFNGFITAFKFANLFLFFSLSYCLHSGYKNPFQSSFYKSIKAIGRK